MRRTRRRDAADAAIAHAKERARWFVRTRRLPHFAHAQHTVMPVAISLPLHCGPQQHAIVVRFRLAVPIDARNVTLNRKAIVCTTRAPLIHELHEEAAATWRSTLPQIATNAEE